MSVHGTFDSSSVPHAQDHVDLLPRVVAIVASSLGALAVVVVAVLTVRRRPVANALLVAAVGAAAIASALTQTAVAAAAAGFAVAAALLYAGRDPKDVTPAAAAPGRDRLPPDVYAASIRSKNER